MSSQQRKNSFYGGVAVLTVSTVIVKLIGALYKIPLGIILTDSAYADFNGAYNIYNFFLTISTAGLPVALSKTVSEAHALGRRNQVDRVFRVAFVAFLTMGLFSFFCMSVLAGPFSSIVISNPKAIYCVMALSPSVLCVCICSAYRGYAQGHLNMYPTAISQVIESLCKLIVGVSLAVIILKMAIQPPEFGDRMAAVGAIAGVSVGSVLSLLFLWFNRVRSRQRLKSPATDRADSSRDILIRLLKLAIPITLGSATTSIVTLVDTKLVMSQLQGVFETLQTALAGRVEVGTGFLGITQHAMNLLQDNMDLVSAGSTAIDPILDSARSLYGVYGKAMNIYNLPFSLMIPLTACIVPAVSACRAKRDHTGARRISESVLRISALLALPAGAGLFALGGPIMGLIYFGKVDTAIAGPLLSVLGLASIFVCFQLICTSILQAHGMVNLPIITVVVGGIVKIVVNYALVGQANIMIYGAPVGTLSCFAVVSVLNLMIIKRVIPNPPNYTQAFLKPLIASIVMGIAAWASYGLFSGPLGLGNSISTLGAIVVGMFLYLVLVLALRVVSREDLELMPKGDKIARILHIK